MRRFLTPLLLVGLLWAGVASAQPWGGFLEKSASAPPAFTGPCDLGVTCTNGWGAERLTSGYTGNLINVCLAIATTTCTDLAYDGTGGISSTSVASAGGTANTFGCTNDTACLVKIEYSQFSGCNLTNASSSFWPFLRMTTTENGHASIYGNATQTMTLSCTDSTSPAALTVLAVGTWSIAANPSLDIFEEYSATNGPVFNLRINSATTTPTFQANRAFIANSGGTTVSASTTIACWAGTMNSSAVQGFFNSTGDTAGSSAADTSAKTWYVGGDQNGSNIWIAGEVNAVMIFNSVLTSGNITTVGHKSSQFWQSSPSC